MTIDDLLCTLRDELAASHLLPCTLTRDATDCALIDTFRRCPECNEDLVTLEELVAMTNNARTVDDLESELERLDAAHECSIPSTLRSNPVVPWSTS